MKVEHQTQQCQFVLEVQGHVAKLEYQISGQHINFTHTFVPQALRGQGIAEQLVKAGLSWANQQRLDIQASCSYVQRFLS